MSSSFGIIYALIAHNNTVLCEYSHGSANGNFDAIARQILDRMEGDRMSLSWERYLFHYVRTADLTCLCLAEDSFGRRIPFAFLNDIQKLFTEKYGDRVAVAHNYEMQEFSKDLSERMHFFNTCPSSDAFRAATQSIEEVKDIMTQNISKLLDRGEKIEILVDKTDHLNTASLEFKKRSRALRRNMWWKKVRLMVVLGTVTGSLVYIGGGIGCGFPDWKGCV